MKEQYEFLPELSGRVHGRAPDRREQRRERLVGQEHAERTDLSEPSGDAADSYHRYGEDIRMLADAGLGMYRFSIEWARIEPAEAASPKRSCCTTAK